MLRSAARTVLLVVAIVTVTSCVALGRPGDFESSSQAGHEAWLVSLPNDLGQFVDGSDAIFIGTIISAEDVYITPQASYSTTETLSGIERYMTQAAGTASASGLPVPPTVDGYTNESAVTIYEASIEKVYYDPQGILGGDTITFTEGGHVEDSATATAFPIPGEWVREGPFGVDAEQFKPQVGERSLFRLSKWLGGDNRLYDLYSGRLDLSGDHVRYYTNPPSAIRFHDRTLVEDFLDDLEAEIASR